MAGGLGYDAEVKRAFCNGLQFFGLVALAALAVSSLSVAQINGVPASVTSMGFGGSHSFTPGIPASVTSLGSQGFQNSRPFFIQPPCCINPLFPVNPNPPVGRHHHRSSNFVPFVTPVYAAPVYGVPYGVEMYQQPAEEVEETEPDQGGPTIFDRRGTGAARESAYESSTRRDIDRRDLDDATEAIAPSSNFPEPAVPQPLTVLVYRDGRQVEVQNYAIQGDVLFDLTPGHPRKIPLSDLDLDATSKANDDRGLDFRLPNRPSGD